MKKLVTGFSPALCALMLVSCGGKDVGSDSETVDMAVSVEPGTVASSLAGDDDALGLIDLKNVAFKYVIKGCKSGYKKNATSEWVTEKTSIKLFKNDTGCIAELAGIKMNGSEFTKIYKKDNTTKVEVSVDGAKAASGSVNCAQKDNCTAAELSYFYYKPGTDPAVGQVQFVLKVPDTGTFDTTKANSLKWTFESIRSDLTTRKVSDAGFSQGMSVGALEAPNLTMQGSNNTAGTLNFVGTLSPLTVGTGASAKTYSGWEIDVTFVCNDDATTNTAKTTGTGANATCRTPGGDQQKLSNMKAVIVDGRADDTSALSFDQAADKFAIADKITATGASGASKAGAEASTKVIFANVAWQITEMVDPNKTYKGWLIVRMEDTDSSNNKFYSYSVTNVELGVQSP
ncbi:MAG: hypothetical protein EBR09_05000 [Proteobacteria bacterium]|nr:hypothetical protein [Pseudomonadota bacterium]